MVKAGKPVDDVIDELAPHLEPGDIVIDGGNSLFTDTSRRFHGLAAKNLRFIGMGVSGGEEGALEGPSMMPGGDRDAYRRIEPIVTKMAAQVDGEPCCAYIGPEGSGHYVKMVHNGIEYADMQLIAEAYDLLKTVYGLDAGAIADIFDEWNKGELDSYLIEITTAVLRKRDDHGRRARRRHSRRGRAEGHRPLDRTIRARSRRAADLDHRGGLCAGAIGPARAAHRRREALSSSDLDRAQAGAGRYRRHPPSALRLQDRRLCARLRANDGRVPRVQLGFEARRSIEPLARGLHHPRPLPQTHPRRL